MPEYEDEESRTIFCANLSEKVTEALLFELFLQAGPIEKVCLPKDKDGRFRTFGFITFVHALSVSYAVSLFQGTHLFNRELTIKPRHSNYSNVQRPEMPVSQMPISIRNNFEDGRKRFERNQQPAFGAKSFDQSSLRLGFTPIPTKALMQPQKSERSIQPALSNKLDPNVIDKLMSLGSQMLQPNKHHSSSKRSTDHYYNDRERIDRFASNLKVSNRQNSRSHHRDQPYYRSDISRHKHSSSRDRRRH